MDESRDEMIPLSHYLILGAIIFSLGVFGALTRRNAIAILMSIELMLNAVNLNFIAFARYLPQTLLQGQVFAIFVITVAAGEAAIGLGIIVAVYRMKGTVEADTVRELEG